MVLNPNGIEPTFLKLGSWSPEAGFIPILNCICSVLRWRIPAQNLLDSEKNGFATLFSFSSFLFLFRREEKKG
jgi:hypothetical protein